MSISNYTELKTAVTDWMARVDLTGKAEDFITLAEARLNREIDAVEADATLTGVAGSRRVDTTALKVIEPIAMFIKINGNERELVQKADGTFPYTDTPDEPSFYAMDGANIDFDCPCSQAYEFRFRYRGRFALSNDTPTNDLLTDHPDVYLSAVLVWGGVFIKDAPQAAYFKQLLDEFMAETKHTISQRNRAIISPPMELARLTGRRAYDGEHS